MSKIKHSSKSHRCLFAFYRRIFLKLLLGLKERLNTFRSSRPEVFLTKGVLKIYSKFTGEHPCRSAISIKLLCNFIEIALRYGCSPVSLLHIFRKPFSRNTSGWLLLVRPFSVIFETFLCYFRCFFRLYILSISPQCSFSIPWNSKVE